MNGIKEFLPLVVIAITTLIIALTTVTQNFLAVLCYVLFLESLLFSHFNMSININTNLKINDSDFIIIITAIIAMLLSQEMLAIIFLITAIVSMTIKLLVMIVIGTIGSYFFI